MSMKMRTTIMLPEDLYERLKTVAFYQKRTLSDLVVEGVSRVVSYRRSESSKELGKLIGKYHVKGRKGEFQRSEFYGELIRKDMFD